MLIGHNCQATVAKFSPSGYYIASGDVQGNVKIWDATQQEHILKIETKSLTGKVNDICWDFESKRVVAVGDGKDKFGHCFLYDSASSCGEILGHSKAINVNLLKQSVSVKPSRPFKAVTGSDDFGVNFYNAVPYKFSHSIKEHSRFVQCVRYSPQGDQFVSTSSDGKIILYDGKLGTKVGEFSIDENTHKGTVFAACWSGDSKEILTAGADMTCKIWDVATMKVLNTVKFCDNNNANYQQVGALWAGSYVISLSLNGDLNYLDPRVNKPVKIVKGHQKGISSLAISGDTMFTGSSDGMIRYWKNNSGGEEVMGQGHNNRVISMGSSNDKVYSCGMDDSFRALSIDSKQFE